MIGEDVSLSETVTIRYNKEFFHYTLQYVNKCVYNPQFCSFHNLKLFSMYIFFKEFSKIRQKHPDIFGTIVFFRVIAR